jgi:hypothetical protein
MSDHHCDKCETLAEIKLADRTALKQEIKLELSQDEMKQRAIDAIENDRKRQKSFENKAWAFVAAGILSCPMFFFYHINTATNKPSGFIDTTANVLIAYIESGLFLVAGLGFVDWVNKK